MDMEEKLKELGKLVKKYGKEQPYRNFAGPFFVFQRKVEEEGVLTGKTKELIMIALSIVKQCDWCVAYHTKTALDLGVTEEEIIETCMVATVMGGMPALMYSQLVLKAIEDFKK